jgi:hypothetical protein
MGDIMIDPIHCTPLKNRCNLDCDDCEFDEECKFGLAIKKKITQIQINMRARTKRANERYGYNITHMRRNDIKTLIHTTLTNEGVKKNGYCS